MVNKKSFNTAWLLIILVSTLLISMLSVLASAATNTTMCCEKTTSGLYCQNTLQSECNTNYRMTPSSCDSTSFCKPGVCYDSSQGDCASNTPKIVCDNNNGTWTEVSPDSCSLGCCTLGDQAAFVSLVKCKRLSAMLGLTTNYNKNLKDETSCVLSVLSDQKGACVYQSEYEKTCKFTTRSVCDSTTSDNSSKATFYANKLCTAPELGTVCGKTENTICLSGKDEVYFVDTCGNPANIYDSSKLTNTDYWTDVKTKTESCGSGAANLVSKTCGNCNYLLGSFCRSSDDTGKSASYGDYICADLNCYNTQNGNIYKHGESWCVYNDKGTAGAGNNSVGSRYYKHICVNGEEVLEQCADYRSEECIQDSINTSSTTFSQAACRVNRWQDCTAQTDQEDCENTDQRDCFWKSLAYAVNTSSSSICLPQINPGLKFWSSTDAESVCAQANAQCIVVYEKSLFGNKKCKKNCECLTDAWKSEKNAVCSALGDCGGKINWVGSGGYITGYNVTIKG